MTDLIPTEQAIIDEIRAAKDRTELAVALRKHDALASSTNVRERGHSINCRGWGHEKDASTNAPWCPLAAVGLARGNEFSEAEVARIKGMSAVELLTYMVEGPGAGIIFEGGDLEYAAIRERVAALKSPSSVNEFIDAEVWVPVEVEEQRNAARAEVERLSAEVERLSAQPAVPAEPRSCDTVELEIAFGELRGAAREFSEVDSLIGCYADTDKRMDDEKRAERRWSRDQLKAAALRCAAAELEMYPSSLELLPGTAAAQHLKTRADAIEIGKEKS